jgi:hypothetical protein
VLPAPTATIKTHGLNPQLNELKQLFTNGSARHPHTATPQCAADPVPLLRTARANVAVLAD